MYKLEVLIFFYKNVRFSGIKKRVILKKYKREKVQENYSGHKFNDQKEEKTN